jgi:hypothetical protein
MNVLECVDLAEIILRELLEDEDDVELTLLPLVNKRFHEIVSAYVHKSPPRFKFRYPAPGFMLVCRDAEHLLRYMVDCDLFSWRGVLAGSWTIVGHANIDLVRHWVSKYPPRDDVKKALLKRFPDF